MIPHILTLNKKTIGEVKRQYACPLYIIDNLNNIKNHDIPFSIKDQLFIDIFLYEIRGKSISYFVFNKAKSNERGKELEKDDTFLIEGQRAEFNEMSLHILSNKQDELLNIKYIYIEMSMFQVKI